MRQPTRTRAKQAVFVTALSSYGTIDRAAKEAGIHRCTHYRWLKDAEYAKASEEAEEIFRDSIRNEVHIRAIEGWHEPVVYKGRVQFVEERNKYGKLAVN